MIWNYLWILRRIPVWTSFPIDWITLGEIFYPIGLMCPLNWMVWMMCSFSKHFHSLECDDTHNLYMRTFIHESICSWEHDSIYSWGHLFMMVFTHEIGHSWDSWECLFMKVFIHESIILRKCLDLWSTINAFAHIMRYFFLLVFVHEGICSLRYFSFLSKFQYNVFRSNF